MLDGLMEWFEPRRLAYPWRRPRPDPYAVLVSEVMLQQTQASRVAPAFERFLRSFPTVRSLATAPAAEVVRAWAGLGYNRRAVALWEAARTIVSSHGGRVPDDPSALSELPGVGPYTAAAVASIAFGRPVAAVDSLPTPSEPPPSARSTGRTREAGTRRSWTSAGRCAGRPHGARPVPWPGSAGSRRGGPAPQARAGGIPPSVVRSGSSGGGWSKRFGPVRPRSARSPA